MKWGGERQRRSLVGLAVVMIILAAGCRQDMHDQPRYEPLEASTFFADGRASRPPVTGTVARGQLFDDPHLYEGKTDGEFATTFPFEVTMDVMQRGRERYDIFCSPCHDRLGTGQGMVVQRGLSGPVSFHDQRLRDAHPGYLFDVITRGFGRMSGYAAQIPVKDRWAIVAYTRALQESRTAGLADVPPAARERLEESREEAP